MVLLYAGLFVARADGRGLKRSVRLAAGVYEPRQGPALGKGWGTQNPKKVDARPTLSLHLRDESPMNPYESRCGKASTGFRNRSERGRGTHG